MPSWNIHSGVTETLLEKLGNPRAYGIRDTNAFLFGNLVPDIYVGYMVCDVSHTLRYIDTHFADPEHIPVPRADEFWNTWIEPLIARGGVDDVTLGAWAHLATDHEYNEAVRAFNKEHGVEPGEETRKRKQHDFELFGHGLPLSMHLTKTPNLVRQAAHFCQYSIAEEDVEATIRSFEAHIAALKKPTGPPEYELLSKEFLGATARRTLEVLLAKLSYYAEGVSSAGFAFDGNAPEFLGDRPAINEGPAPPILLKDDPQAAAAINTAKVGGAEGSPAKIRLPKKES